MTVNRKLLEQELARAGQITERAVSGQGFDPRGGYGVLAAQLGTAAIGAFAQKRAKDKILAQEEQRNIALSKVTGLGLDLVSQLSDSSKQSAMDLALKSRLSQPEQLKYDIRESDQGFVRINAQTGTAEPIMTNGEQLKSKVKAPETVVNIGDKRTKLDDRLLEKAFDQSTASEALSPLIDRSEKLVEAIETSPFANVAFKASTIANIVSGGNYNPESLKDYQELEAISKEFGARTLSLFGGNDSNRELLVAIATNVSLDKKNETNLNIIKRKRVATNILRSRPDFQLQWIQENGSILSKNKAGENFIKSWRNYQDQKWKEESKNLPKPEINKKERKSIIDGIQKTRKQKNNIDQQQNSSSEEVLDFNDLPDEK